MEVSAKELRLHLSDYLKRVARGHTVDVSMRGRQIARLIPVKESCPAEEDPLFGIWADRKDLDVSAEVRDIRKERSF